MANHQYRAKVKVRRQRRNPVSQAALLVMLAFILHDYAAQLFG